MEHQIYSFFLPNLVIRVIFRWIGECLGKGWGLTCLLILWFQLILNFGMGMPSFTATIMFYTPNYDAAVKFAQALQHELLIMTGWIILYWVLTYLATKGVKAFSNIAKYGVIIASLILLTVIIAMIIPEKQINVSLLCIQDFRINNWNAEVVDFYHTGSNKTINITCLHI